MRRSKMTFLTVCAIFILLAGWGCSGNGDGGAIAPDLQTPRVSTGGQGTGLWGMYSVSIDPDTHQVDIVGLRQAELGANVLGFMEPPALVNLNIDFNTLVIDDVNQTISVDVLFTHPLVTPENVFHGFDVRGIVFGPELANADGLTPVCNPADFDGVPFGYIDGLLGAPNVLGAYDGLWGYKYFCDGLGLDDDLATFFSDELNLTNRGIFTEGTTNSRHYELDWTNSVQDFFVFNYAVYANYDWPVGDPPFDIDSFNLTSANAFEPFCAQITEVANTLNYFDPDGTGAISLDVEVWDWQGNASTGVAIEAPAGGLVSTPFDSMDVGNTTKSSIFHFVDLAVVPASTADIDFLITTTSEKTFGESWFMDLFPTDHPLYGVLLYDCWEFSASVTNEPPAGGSPWNLIDSDVLPDVPYQNDVEFCVKAGGADPGVYIWGENYAIDYYPLDYSDVSSTLKTCVGNYGYTMLQLMGADNLLGSLEIDGSGAIMATSNATTITWSAPYLCNSNMFWWSAGATLLTNASVLTASYGTVVTDDLESGFDPYSVIWGHDQTHVDNNYNGNDVEVVLFGLGVPYDSGSHYAYFSIDWGPLDESAGGSLDGEVSDDAEASRFAVDSDPEGLSGGHNVIFYYLENSPDDNKVEAVSSVATSMGAASTSLITMPETNWDGTAVDIVVFNIYGNDDPGDATGNWLLVLEDNGDSTWQFAAFDQDGTLIERSDTYDGDVVDGNGDPYGIDVDSIDQLVHVWSDNGGLEYSIFEWAP